MKPKGIFLKKVYEWVKWPEDATIVDLGSWNGTTSSWFASRAKKGKIFSVEPVKEMMDIAKLNAKFYELDNIIYCPIAISDKNGESNFYIYENRSEGNSLFLKSEKTRHYLEREITVKTMTWDTFVDTYGITKVDYCKVNIEGAETLLLKGMTKVFPERMIIEDHSRLKITDYYEIRQLIKDKGYEIIKEEHHDLWCIKTC